MGFKFLVVTSLLLITLVENGQSKEITNELDDLKDAIISLTKLMRDNTEKLERHEFRDKQFAEQVKKSLLSLTKRLTVIDGFKDYLEKIDERVAGLEQLISQKDERERNQLQRTSDNLEDLQNRLEGWATEIETKVLEASSKICTSSGDVLTKFEVSEPKTTEKLDNPSELVQSIYNEVRQVCRRMHSDEDFSPSIQNDHSITSKTHSLQRMQELLQNTIDQIRDLPRSSELQNMHRETQLSVKETQHMLKNAIGLGNENLEKRISENNEETKDLLNILSSNVDSQATRTNQELKELGKSQSVMVEMADHVLDTRKRLEHAYKIVQEVGELVMAQGININNTLNTRFNGISNDIMDNQNGALSNLTLKMEQEMSQVWRQINVMYQQMMESAKALDKLHEQNEAYVNGTTSTMDGMESKVGEITKRMSEVDTNLNYLLGRLSLVTQEFNQIKSGLGAALDKIKESFKEVQEKANEFSNPGPHPVPQDYKELDSSTEKEKPK